MSKGEIFDGFIMHYAFMMSKFDAESKFDTLQIAAVSQIFDTGRQMLETGRLFFTIFDLWNQNFHFSTIEESG